jgi:hypothetical protein
VSGLGSRDDWSVGDEREVDTGVRDQVGLELVQIDIEGPVETKRGGDGGNNCIIVSTTVGTLSGKFSGSYPTLSNQAVQVLVVGTLQAEVAAADVINGLVVDHEGAVGVLEGGVGGEDGVVRLNNGSGSLRGRVDAEFQLALLAVVDRQTLHEESTKTGTSTTTEGVEDEETLESNTVVGNTADLVEDAINQLLADCVVSTGIVVGGILLAGDHHLGVEKVAVGTGADLVDDIGLEIAVDSTGNVLALAYKQ